RGIDAVDRPGLLHVPLEAVEDRPLLARGEVLEEDLALAAHPADEREGLAVRRRSGADRAARAGDEFRGLALLPIEALDDVDLGVGVLVVLEDGAGGCVLAVVEVASVGREGRLARVLLIVRLLGDLEAATTAP